MHNKIIFTISLLLLMNLAVWSQTDANALKHCKRYRDKIKTEQIAYITNKLDFTVKEAQEFWPVFNQHHTQINKIKEQMYLNFKKIRTEKDPNKKDYLNFLKQNEKLRTEEIKLEKNFEKQLLKILPAKKVVLLHLSEKDFKRKIVHDMRKGKNCKFKTPLAN